MALSGYPEGFRAKVILGGLTGYLKTLKKSVLNGSPIHSLWHEISESKKKKHPQNSLKANSKSSGRLCLFLLLQSTKMEDGDE